MPHVTLCQTDGGTSHCSTTTARHLPAVFQDQGPLLGITRNSAKQVCKPKNTKFTLVKQKRYTAAFKVMARDYTLKHVIRRSRTAGSSLFKQSNYFLPEIAESEDLNVLTCLPVYPDHFHNNYCGFEYLCFLLPRHLSHNIAAGTPHTSQPGSSFPPKQRQTLTKERNILPTEGALT